MAEIVPSEELRSFLLRLYAAMEDRDLQTFREMFSSSAQLLIAGSDPAEWFTGSSGVDVFFAQVMELPVVRIEPGDIQSFSCGTVGWVADQPILRFPDGEEDGKRVTAVLTIEKGHWRVIQWHAATPVTNEESIGRTLTTSIDQVAWAVREDRPDMAPTSAPDGTVTVVFSDIESSTVLLERLGDAEFTRMLAWHDRILRDTAEEHRGYVVKSQGDGFMLAFPSAAYGLRSCIVTRNRLSEGYCGLPIRVRAGLHAGEALRHENDFYGRTVVIAARISALALGNEILASDLVHTLALDVGTFTFGEPRSTNLKGLEGGFTVYPVVA